MNELDVEYLLSLTDGLAASGELTASDVAEIHRYIDNRRVPAAIGILEARAAIRVDLSRSCQPNTGDLVGRILGLVAELSGESPLTCPPLGKTIDIEALSRLVSSQCSDDGSFHVEFEYHNCVIEIDHKCRIFVHRPEQT